MPVQTNRVKAATAFAWLTVLALSGLGATAEEVQAPLSTPKS